ncbi:metal-dependent hydrolase family protein [Chromobacterium haemolyticum]|uniref:metal-dependent hydrolase family protein n=1 Tax=Chromobacterium haemolyticum TaxID=394935 RepID=UPI000DEEEB0D|nr:amidohydrolase family protein [Chromobacterium haemolyticum]
MQKLALVLLMLTTSMVHAHGQEAAEPPLPVSKPVPELQTLITGARIFDGKSKQLSAPANVLVRGNKIVKISALPISIERSANVVLIDAEGRTLMPGLIDAHTHMAQSVVPLPVLMTADPNYTQIVQAKAAGDMLMRGFTSARDLSGPTFGMKRAIDEGHIPGPRIWPSGAAISQTSGHADFRSHFDLPRKDGSPAHFSERLGYAVIADSPDEVRRGAREQLLQGASLLKVMAGGGVASNYDPLDVAQYSEAEIHAAVEAADNWGTYVTVHAYTPKAIQTAIRAGVKCIDHGQLADEASAKLMAEKGIWWSLQPFLEDEDMIPFPEGSVNRAKQLQMLKGTDNAYQLAKKYKIKTAFGTDTLFDAKLASRQGAQLAKLVRWYTPAQVLKMATADNGELLALSGLRSPYPGKIGVVEEGALADLLLVDGNPIADIKLIENPAKNFTVIMKDGVIYKNTMRKAPLPNSQN